MLSDRETALDACMRVTEEMRAYLPKTKPHKIKSLSLYFAERITSPDQQDAIMIIEGKRGTGKSTSAISIAEATSKQVSIIKYGDETHADEFFNIDENVAIIDPNSCFKLISTLDKPHSIIVLDDIGVSLSHMRSQSNINQLIDNLIQTCRVRQIFIILTTPNQNFISKTTRLCSNYIMSIEETHHSAGYNLCSVKTVEEGYNHKTIYPFLLASELGSSEIGARRAKINRWRIYAPKDTELIRKYDLKRAEETQKQLDMTGEKIEYLLKKEHAKATGKDDVIAKTADLSKSDKIDKLIEKQGYSLTKACKIVGLSKYKYKNASDYYKTVLVIQNAKS